jgi:uncharacterized protein (TIGR01777 family)
MKVAITGGSGFVGTQLSRKLLDAGHEVLSFGTRAIYRDVDHPAFTYQSADTTQPGDWQQGIADADVIYNLAGRTIFQRWTRRYKQQIYDSRILTTRHLVAALTKVSRKVLVSTSAVGCYGDCGDTELTESSPLGNDFLAEVSRDWEAEAMGAEAKGVRVAIARFGIVLGADGGALAKMVPAFRSFVGGPLGGGRQWFPWIHMLDLVGVLEFLAFTESLNGPFNLTAPNPVRNKAMAATLGKVLGRPALLAAPAFMLKLAMGELSGVLLASQRALPSKLLEAGYDFAFPSIEAALENLVQ